MAIRRKAQPIPSQIGWPSRDTPFQLDPTASPGKSGPVLDAYAKKFGGPEPAQEIIDRVTSVAADSGIEFRMDRALCEHVVGPSTALAGVGNRPAGGDERAVVAGVFHRLG